MTFKVGLIVNGMRMKEYDLTDYAQALEDLKYVYEETEIPHELRIYEEGNV